MGPYQARRFRRAGAGPFLIGGGDRKSTRLNSSHQIISYALTSTLLPYTTLFRSGIDAAITTLRELGAEIREVQVSPLQDWGACGSLISITERAAAYEEWARTRHADFGERVQAHSS